MKIDDLNVPNTILTRSFLFSRLILIMISKSKKNINMKPFKEPVPIRPKPTVPEQNSLPSIPSIDITTEPESTSKETAIDLTEVYILLLFA